MTYSPLIITEENFGVIFNALTQYRNEQNSLGRDAIHHRKVIENTKIKLEECVNKNDLPEIHTLISQVNEDDDNGEYNDPVLFYAALIRCISQVYMDDKADMENFHAALSNVTREIKKELIDYIQKHY